MSDLSAVRQKVEEGIEWRGAIRVSINDEEHELTVRQLRDPEFFEVMSMIDREELEELQEELPEETMDEFRDLQTKEELDEDEEERLDELREELEGSTTDMFQVLSEETFEGIRLAGKYAVEPDEEDMQNAFRERAAEIERQYGIKVQTPEDVYDALKDDIRAMIDDATQLTSFTIGMQALVESVGQSEGN